MDMWILTAYMLSKIETTKLEFTAQLLKTNFHADLFFFLLVKWNLSNSRLDKSTKWSDFRLDSFTLKISYLSVIPTGFTSTNCRFYRLILCRPLVGFNDWFYFDNLSVTSLRPLVGLTTSTTIRLITSTTSWFTQQLVSKMK